MKLWLDDIRIMPQEYDTWVKTAAEAIAILKTGDVTDISFDHDLGDEKLVGNGYHVAKWIEESAYNNEIPRISWKVHSANSVGRKNITDAMINADIFWSEHEHR